MALYLVRQLTSSELLQRLKTIGVKHPELCKALGERRGPSPRFRGSSAPSLPSCPLLCVGACPLGGTDGETGSSGRSLEDAVRGSAGRGERVVLTDRMEQARAWGR